MPAAVAPIVRQVAERARRDVGFGAAVGNRTWFPAWQFDDDPVRPDLPRILELLARFTFDPLAADRIMRLKHDELGGISIAEALRNTQTAETAWRMLTSIGA
jgi:hypothetical protein